MIQYDSKNWSRVIFSIRATVLPAVFRRLWIFVALTIGVWVMEEQIPYTAWLFKPFKPVGHSLLGLALGLLIVFHNNCAYDRYWEGRKLWGSLVNTSRNLVRGFVAYVGHSADAVAFGKLVSAYVYAVKKHLRADRDLAVIQQWLPSELFGQVLSAGNPPSMLSLRMSQWIAEIARSGRIDSVTAQSLEAMVRSLLDSQGGCERILKTPIPFAYAVHIRQMLTVYLVTLPFALVGEMGWAAIPTVAVVAFGMLGIEEAGNEIENPFGTDPNDLPLEQICETIARDCAELTHKA